MKNKLIGLFLFIMIFISACSSKGEIMNDSSRDDLQVETNIEEKKVEENKTDPEEETEKEKSENSEEETDEYKIEDFFKVDSDIEYVYEGDGGEFSSYKQYIDFFNNNKKQIRELNGGTEVVYVIEKTENEIKKIYEMPETYYKENFLYKKSNRNIIKLKNPIVVGNKWDNKEFGKSEITDINKEVETSLGNFKTVEVTTIKTIEGKQTILKEYYAKDIGLVKSIFKDEPYEVNVVLKEINNNKSFKSKLNFYYPNVNEDRLFLYKKELEFKTNDIPRKLIESLYKDYPDEVGTVLTENTKINHLYLNEDGMAYIDLSKDFITEMNAGSGVEAMIIQSIANTVGDYFGVKRVMLTVEDEPYESGHLLFGKFEPIEVNYDGIVDKN